MTWRSVKDSTPAVGASVLVWIEYRRSDGSWGDGEVEVAGFRSQRMVYGYDDDVLIGGVITDDHFHWSGGDNDRDYPRATGLTGEGGYGVDDGRDRVTHWMPLPEAP